MDICVDTIEKAIGNFIKSSQNSYITIDKIKQLRKDCNTTIKQCLTTYLNVYIRYRNTYLSITINHNTYILKFDSAASFLYFSEEFDINRENINKILDRNYDVFNYDEQEIVQDGYTYNIITEEVINDIVYIIVVDKESRIQVLNINIYIESSMNIYDTNISIYTSNLAKVRFKLKPNVCTYYKNILTGNIKNYVSAQLTLLFLKGK